MPPNFMQWPFAKTYPSGDRGMVASKHPLASQAGVEVLQSGGNAVDAAVATSFALGVVEPFMSGVGGGGLALFQPRNQPPKAFHFGMRAPRSAYPEMYRVIPGSVDSDLFGWPRTVGDENLHGPLSIAVPGQVPGLLRLWQEGGGRLPWKDLLQPAIKYADQGITVDWLLSLRTLEGYELLKRFPFSESVFLPNGRPPKPDLGLGAEVLRQPELALTLRCIADDPQAFGKGQLAQSIADAANKRITPAEIGEYESQVDEPLTISFAGLEVHLVPGATGGATVLEWLGILRELRPPVDADGLDFWSAVISAGLVAMSDRLSLLADPDFVPFPEHLLQPDYHRQRADAIKAGEVEPLLMPPAVGSTSHLAVVDAQENAITLTQSLLSLWGSGVVTQTGICMNNGMMWFDPEPGRPNSIEPGKLPLANMSPVLVTKGGQPVFAYGASGGRRILPAVVQVFLRIALFGDSLEEAIAAPRLEITNREIRADPRFGEAFCRQLSQRLDHPVIMRNPILGSSPWASPVGLMRLEDGNWTGGADPYTNACVFEA